MSSSPRPTNTRRLLLAGKGQIACDVLDHAVHALKVWGLHDWTVLGLPTRKDPGHDTWEPSFSARCRTLEVPLVDSVVAAALGPQDLFISLQYDKIVRLADLAGAPAFNLHFSVLPRHRGCYPGMWALRMGDDHAGVSLHVLTAGIDDGAVLDQLQIPIHEFTTARALYDQMHLCGATLVCRHLPGLLRHQITAQVQDIAGVTYHDRHSIDFKQLELPYEAMDVTSCSGLARSLMFPPFQFPTIQGRAIIACDILRDLPGAPSAPPPAGIQPIGPDMLLLRCLDGWLRVTLASDIPAANAP